MSRAARAGALAAVLAALCAAPAAGQSHGGAVGYGGGGIWFGSLAEGIELDPGWVANVQAEQWYWRGRVAARGNVAFTQRPLHSSTDERQINTWIFDGSVLLRPVPAREDRRVAPYVSLGAGVVNYGFGRGRQVVLGDGAVYPGSGERQFAVVGGAGIDFLPRVALFDTPLGLRLDFADHVTLESPFQDAGGNAYGPVHNVRVTLGLIGLVGQR